MTHTKRNWAVPRYIGGPVRRIRGNERERRRAVSSASGCKGAGESGNGISLYIVEAAARHAEKLVGGKRYDWHKSQSYTIVGKRDRSGNRASARHCHRDGAVSDRSGIDPIAHHGNNLNIHRRVSLVIGWTNGNHRGRGRVCARICGEVTRVGHTWIAAAIVIVGRLSDVKLVLRVRCEGRGRREGRGGPI